MDFSKYDPNNCCKSTTEYDLWMCINNDSSNTTKFGLHHGDVSQKHVLLRSKRAYLVKSTSEHT